jgi:hypothetical protein
MLRTDVPFLARPDTPRFFRAEFISVGWQEVAFEPTYPFQGVYYNRYFTIDNPDPKGG